MARKKAVIDEVELDLTPMIDVVFLLLIFFIVTMKFKVLEGKLETELPKDVGVNRSEVDELLEKIEINIVQDKAGEHGIKIYVNSRAMGSLASLRGELKRWFVINDESRTTLYPEAKINYEQVIKVVDVILDVGLSDITFAGVRWDM